MANSVVKVTDTMLNDNLLLLVGEDGTVTPDRETVKSYLNSKSGATNIQIMHINKNDSKGIDVSIDNLTYLPDADGEDVLVKNKRVPLTMEEVARNLYNFKLDHDYTSFTSPGSSPLQQTPPEEDELAKTLSILDGSGDHEILKPAVEPLVMPVLIPIKPVSVVLTTPSTPSAKIIRTVSNSESPVINTTTTATTITAPVNPVKQDSFPSEKDSLSLEDSAQVTPKSRRRSKSVSVSKQTRDKAKAKKFEENQDIDNDEDLDDDDFDEELEDDENDSDYEVEEEFKPKTAKRISRRKSESKPQKSPKLTPKKDLKLEIKTPVKTEVKEEPKPVETKTPETPIDKKPPIKKEKKTPKPIPDDFALFSTPDIIRRVGGKEPGSAEITSPKPSKITPDNRSKSNSERSVSPIKSNRLSVDSKIISEPKEKSPQKIENKIKDRRQSIDKTKRSSIDEKCKKLDHKSKSVDQMDVHSSMDSLENQQMHLNEVPTSSVNVGDFNSVAPTEDQNINLDGTGLDLDQTLLDNLNNDLISEDILYQVAQSLVGNTELQNVIDKGINEGKLVLDPSIQQSMAIDSNVVQNTTPNIQETQNHDGLQKGTQIIRSDGRIVTIPPIERPTTRSRNKRRDEEKPSLFKPIHKPLDDEHVSGNELDSSGEEEESEDDPNKLWCICNQPHNNRFMICCDTCEEWYHGKCVNITKAMGQQMESEGKEWICLFCKDPSLRRPQAAARRVRKASRNSRASTDSVDSGKKSDSNSTVSSVPCVVCQKPARKNSIFCSEACILVQAQNVERAVVFDRATGHMLTGSKAPSAANLDQWLKEHPTFEAVKSGGKVVTSKSGNFTQSKLKLVKNSDSEGVSLAIQNKGVNIGVLKHTPKPTVNVKTPTKVTHFKIISKQVPTIQQQQAKTTTPKPITNVPKPMSATPNTAITTPSKVKTVQTLLKPIKQVTTIKEKAIPIKTPKARQQEQQAPQAKQQENIRENVQKTLFEQLTNRLKLVEDLKLSEEEIRSISTDIESQLYKCFGDTGQKYRNKYRSLIFNIKDVKNQTLWRRICEKTINPYELVRLSPDDLASQELALWREREAKHQLDMIKKSELELLNCNRQYVLKTHKGEQVLEDERRLDKIDNTEVIKSLTEGSTLDIVEPKNEKVKDKKTATSKHSHKDKERKSSRDKDHHRRRSSSRERDRSRRRSKSREHSSRKDKKRSRSRDRDKHRKSHKSSKHKKEGPIETSKLDPKSKEILDKLVVNKIVPPLEDRLWRHVPQEDIVPTAESDSDHEPSSTVTIPTPPRSSDPDDFQSNQSSAEKQDKEKSSEERSTSPPPKQQSAEIWKGTISMIDVAQISITAHEVSGDCQGLGNELSANLEIVGRISPDTVWDYISKMKCSNSKMISLVRLNATNMEEKMPYLALYSYLSSRTRLGVVKSTNKAVKDFYILPLAPQKPIPQALLPINGPGFEESRPALLLGIIVRDKRKRPYIDPIINPLPIIKRSRVETPPPVTPATTGRSYTPPPMKDPRLSKLPLPVIPPTPNEEDEPYSPEDSDPDSSIIPIDTSIPPPPIVPPPYPSNKYAKLPGLGSPPIPSNPQDLQRQMEELNKKIEMQKSEINSISQNIVTASGSEIGTSALANIALPSNLQQILDSIKTIEAASTTESPDEIISETPTVQAPSSDLTIPLMIPKTFPKRLQTPPKTSTLDLTSDTIPLVLPSKPKIKPLSVNSPLREPEKPNSVLSSLSEEDLIRKAAEMLGETSDSKNRRNNSLTKSSPQPPKRPKMDLSLPPVPGLEDEVL